MPDTFPALQGDHLHSTDLDALRPAFSTHRPRILILYGSLREISYSRLLAFEARRLLERLGCEVRMFDPRGACFTNFGTGIPVIRGQRFQ